MARKRRGDEYQFGSDSFLDIVANMVGIIIILIVIVGIRVKDIPVSAHFEAMKEKAKAISRSNEEKKAAHQKRLAEWASERDRILAENQRKEREHQAAVARRHEEIRQRAEMAQAAQAAAEAEAKAQTVAREQQLAERERLLLAYQKETEQMESLARDLARQLDLEEAHRRERQTTADQIARKIAEKESQLREVERSLTAEQSQLAERRASWESLSKELVSLREEIARIESRPRPTKSWVHYATAVAQKVSQKEIHFRCRKGRIANLHLDALLERVQDKLVGAGGAANTVSGQVGPIEGFRLQFLATPTYQGLTDRVSNPFLYRLQLATWEIRADSDDLGETETEALRDGSELMRDVKVRPPALYAMTLWVYPDSFEVASAVRRRLHELGYHVALRPIPFDMPIAGAPWGSTSQVQ